MVGPSRSGKSFLLNRLTNGRTFQVGGSTQACTRGIWAHHDGAHLFLDTEGMSAVQRSEHADYILFLFAALASSTLVYNSVGVIDEISLEKFDAISHLIAKVRGDKKQSGDLPNFVWVLRDFLLNLSEESGRTPDEYLEKSLAKRPVSRSTFSYLFSKLSCRTLVRPVIEEKLLKSMDVARETRLRPEFTAQVSELVGFLLSNVGVKTLCRRALTGQTYSVYLRDVVNAINSKKFPNSDLLNVP